MVQKIFSIVLLISIGLGNAKSQKAEEISIGSKHFIQSDILKEEREYWISLPNSYNQEELSYKKYPILILLDGNVHFHSVSGMVNYRSSGNTDKREIPEMIVIGVKWYKKQRTIKGKKFDYLWASGRGGNQLIVIPEENMVIALTSTAYGPNYGHTRAYAFLTKLLEAYE